MEGLAIGAVAYFSVLLLLFIRGAIFRNKPLQWLLLLFVSLIVYGSLQNGLFSNQNPRQVILEWLAYCLLSCLIIYVLDKKQRDQSQSFQSTGKRHWKIKNSGFFLVLDCLWLLTFGVYMYFTGGGMGWDSTNFVFASVAVILTLCVVGEKKYKNLGVFLLLMYWVVGMIFFTI